MRVKALAFCVVLLLLAGGIASITIRAAENQPAAKAEPADTKEKRVSKKAARKTAGRKRSQAAKALQAERFAGKHHPELAELLDQLEDNNPREYRKAVDDVHQSIEKLVRIKERSAERHMLALDAWKLDSRIRLLAARMAMSENPELEEELRQLLRERVDLRLAQLKFEKQKASERLSRFEELIQNIESDPEAAAQRDLQRVKKSLSGRGRSAKTKTKSAKDSAQSKRGEKPSRKKPADVEKK